jgi:hypothetical protein
MRTIEKCTYQNTDLMVLIEEIEDGKAQASYFVNGKEVHRWLDILPCYQVLLMAMLDQHCKDYNLIKWSY